MKPAAIPKPVIFTWACFVLAALFCTYLRISLLVIYPLVIVFLFYLFEWKLARNALYFFGIVAFMWALSLRHGQYLRYNLLSLYYFIPFFLLIFAVPNAGVSKYNFSKTLLNALTIVVFLNDVPGIVQYIAFPNDDSFKGIYGMFTVSQNGLSILNGLLFFYHLNKYRDNKRGIQLILSLFFLVCCVLGFYGAGLMVLIATLMLTLVRIRRKNILQVVIIMLLSLGLVVLLMRLISPYTLEYNVNIIKKFLDPFAVSAPRKIIIFKNYASAYSQNFIDLLAGSGPGTFNSRSAFMVGSPTYFNIDLIKAADQPFYFKNYAYTLWNASNTGPYDGFMNQPFSSLLALCGEYGLIVTCLLIFLIAKQFEKVQALRRIVKKGTTALDFRMYRFCMISVFLFVIIDNYVEYPEIIGLLLIIVKLAEQQIRNQTLASNR